MITHEVVDDWVLEGTDNQLVARYVILGLGIARAELDADGALHVLWNGTGGPQSIPAAVLERLLAHHHRRTAGTLFRHKPTRVRARCWAPGVEIEGVITNPDELIGKYGAHIGHQRELDGTKGLFQTRPGQWTVVQAGDWIVTESDGRLHVMTNQDFQAAFEPT